MRLGSSTTLTSSGVLEIYLFGEWGTVCEEGFGNAEADVACRQLGFEEASQHGSDLGYICVSIHRV